MPVPKKITCLVAHPIGTIRGYLRFFLDEYCGIAMIGTENAIRAIEIVQHEQPDLVIIGGEIDRSGGVDTITAIRARSLRKHPKIIGVALRASGEHIDALRTAGADKVILTTREKELHEALKDLGFLANS